MTLINKYKIIWSPNAHYELQNIKYYIKNYLKEKNTAKNIVRKILSSISKLSYFPEKYAKIQIYNKNNNVRKMSVANYLVIYEDDNISHKVFILHIYHSSQNYFNYL